ncbi:zinc finger domain-containing protein [Streptomyces sp. NPDC001205]
MNRHSQAPMPESIRHQLRAGQHPARSVPCPWCGAAAHRPCQAGKSRLLTGGSLHPQRVSAWAELTACCPTCQVTPTVPCHEDGRERATVHARRYTEAEGAAA